MTNKTLERMALAAANAAEMIRQHVEVGLTPDDVDEDDDDGLMQYSKACEKIAKHLKKLSNMYVNKLKP